MTFGFEGLNTGSVSSNPVGDANTGVAEDGSVTFSKYSCVGDPGAVLWKMMVPSPAGDHDASSSLAWGSLETSAGRAILRLPEAGSESVKSCEPSSSMFEKTTSVPSGDTKGCSSRPGVHVSWNGDDPWAGSSKSWSW